MKPDLNVKILLNIILSLFLFSGTASSQSYSFRNYGEEFKIPSGFVYTINQTDNGFLWVGTGNGIARFDGFDYYPVQYPDSSLNRNPNVSFKAKNGSIWFGCNDGTVYYTKSNKLVSVKLINSRSISQILETPEGRVLIIPQGRYIFSIDPDNPEDIKQYPFKSNQNMYSAAFTPAGDLLIGSEGNLLICNFISDTVYVKETIEGFDYSNVKSIQSTGIDGKFVIGTEDNGLFRLSLTGTFKELTRFKGHPEWSSLRVNSIFTDREKNIWVSTSENGVIQINNSTDTEAPVSAKYFNKNSGLSLNDVLTVFQDAEGNYWFGLSDNPGLSMLSSFAFSFWSPGESITDRNIIFINKYNDRYILGTPAGYHLFDALEGKFLSYTNLSGSLGNTQVLSYYLDNEKNLWIGTDGKGLYVKGIDGKISRFYRSLDSGMDQINDIVIDGKNIWLATTNGVAVIDRNSGQLKKKFDTSKGILTSNLINKIILNSTGNAVIGTQSDRLFLIDTDFNLSVLKGQMSGSAINQIISFVEKKPGEIWVSTKGNGVFEIRNDSAISVNRVNTGLYNDYCYSILADSKGEIWIGHTNGFSRFNPKTGVMDVFGSDFTNSGTCNPNAIYESPDNKVFIGTTSGLVIYERNKDKINRVPPYNNINSIVIENYKTYDYQPVIELPYSRYRITVKYSGISFNSPEKVWYSTLLDGFDLEASKMSANREVTYTLDDGKYKFIMVSVNDRGMSQEPAISFDIVVAKPWWRTWWSILSGVLILVSVVVLIIRERDKSQKKVQLYLETELEARTSVVMKQKVEIEIQNIEITDSINYAKRIQSSILPDINKLKDSFKDAFILFHPRDIVSGDFYWFDKLSEDKFILVCADSTGHGVPGAFMSMIGSTLLQDIVTRKGISRPSEILTLLDKQIFSTLNQNIELGVSNDGMDVVVCEFNIKSRHIRFASAMRPVIIVMDGEPYYIKGNRSSVGGESVIEKYFDDQEYYLNEGDTVYLFSDGLPDQFGGTDGKKMKIARLKRIIEQISKLPMDKQKDAMSKFYYDWKGSYDQVDDVLLMAVRV